MRVRWVWRVQGAGLSRNPLADPYCWVRLGASLGVALALAALGGTGMLGGGNMMNGGGHQCFSSSIWVRLGLTGAAFVGRKIAVMLTLVFCAAWVTRQLLAGVVVGVVLA